MDESNRHLRADGADFVVAYASIRDANDTLVPLANDYVKFSVTGEGAVIGDESIFANPMRAQAGIATALIRATLKPGAVTIRAEAFGLQPATATIQSQRFQVPIVPGAR